MLKLKRFSEGVWFDYPEGGKFKIRPVTPRDFLELHEKARKGKSIIKNIEGKPEVIDDYDEFHFSWLLFCHMVEDWKELEVDGAKTPDEIREAIFNEMVLRDWITERARDVANLYKEQLEQESKNSDSSQSG